MIMARRVHLIGSIPLSSAEEVFTQVSSTLGDRVQSMTDGETGNRSNWMTFQYEIIADHPLFESRNVHSQDTVSAPDMHEQKIYGFNYKIYLAREQEKQRDKVEWQKITWKDGLKYAEHACKSYDLFASMKKKGVIPQHVKFQLDLPTPLAPMAVYLDPQNTFSLLPAYMNAMEAEIQKVLAYIPHGELLIQWDVAVEIGLLEGVMPSVLGKDVEPVITQMLAKLVTYVPADVELGFHLCYGDLGGRHFKEPEDLSLLVKVTNTLVEGSQRKLNYFTMPVPVSRDDAAYFEPLKNLKIPQDTALILGLVHLSDGVEGATRRIKAAEASYSALGRSEPFGISTECGMGRGSSERVKPLLQLHKDIKN